VMLFCCFPKLVSLLKSSSTISSKDVIQNHLTVAPEKSSNAKENSQSSNSAIANFSTNHKLFNGTNNGLLWLDGKHTPLASSPQCIADQDKVQATCQSFLQKNRCESTPAVSETQTTGILTTGTNTTGNETCKTLWFAGLHEGSASLCTAKGGGYRMYYAHALASARLYAANTLQPVLLLGRYGLDMNDHGAAALRTWAQEQGALVIEVDNLSFQQDVAKWHNGTGLMSNNDMGPYLRMDIPQIVRANHLFDIANICSQYVLYTDSDILFASEITHSDMLELKSGLHAKPAAFFLYGPEHIMNPMKPANTGVMLIDVPRFEKELPAMLKFRNEYPEPNKITAFDQGWINFYFKAQEQQGQQQLTGGRALLPMYWNWKAYWKTEPKDIPKIKLVHFHGPKPGRLLWRIAFCKTDLKHVKVPSYHPFILGGICCDGGKTAYHMWELLQVIAPASKDVC
jgi:hypothetical protein